MGSDKGAGEFKVLLTADFYNDDGSLKYDDIGLDLLEQAEQISYTKFAQHRPTIEADQIGQAQGVVVLGPKVTKESLSNSENLLALGRFGVGYDSVDVQACTEADVVLFITAGAVDRPVAEATVAWMLALTHNIRTKDALVRQGQWDIRSQFMGSELRDRTLGVIGLGGIGQALVKLLNGFGMNQPLVFDPYVQPNVAQMLGVQLVPLNELMSQADFVSVNCPLNDQTRGLISRDEIGLMKPEAYLINTARGGIVDEDALFDALQEQKIAGAGIDVFVEEPVTKPHRFGKLDNVLLAPHSIAWTNELFRDIGRAACQGIIDLAQGKKPKGVVNPEVFEKVSFQKKWDRLRAR